MAVPVATTGSNLALASLVGRRLGEFQLLEEIGSGSFGVIYRAEQVGLRRAAVVKVLRPRFAGHETQQLRFLREARLASTLDHPYAAHVYAFGAEPDGLLWIAMELVRGIPLSELLRKGPVPLATLVPFLERLCEVVQTSHEHGIIHRDIKPNNVMVITRAGALLPKLLDLGIAKDGADAHGLAEASLFYQDALSSVRSRAPTPEPPRTDPHRVRTIAGESQDRRVASASGSNGTPSDALTQEGDVIGSPAYMAPEQWTNPDQVDHRCDIYALGVLAYEAIAGRRPFQGTQRELAGQHLGAPLPRLPDALPAALHDALSHAMAKDRADRPATVLDFVRELRHASGLASELIALPRLARDVADVALREYPQPIAEAVEELEGVSGAHQAVDATARLLRVVVRWLAVVALAAWQSRHPRQALSGAGAELLGALRSRKLSDAEWLELAVASVSPYRFDPERHPVPPLVRLFFEEAELIEELTHVLQRHAARTVSPLLPERAAAEEAQCLLEKASRVLRGISFSSDYLLAVVGEDGEAVLWMGARRRHRVTQPLPATAGPWEAGSPLLLCGGDRVLNLAPLAVAKRPSPNAEPELFLADGQGRRGVLLVALPAGFEMTSDAASEWLRHTCSVSDDEVESAPRVLETPYRGLAPLTASDADLFFGREREVEAFLNRMRAEPLLVVVGPSGAGKSSFVRAGVVPALDGSHRAIEFRPGRTPLATLRAKLASFGVRTEDFGEASYAREVARRVHAVARERRETFVFFIDQFEETFTLAHDVSERAAFSAWLSAMSSTPGDPVRVVLALRDDFLKNAQQETAFRHRLEHSLAMLATPDASVLRRILTEPARRAGFSFETDSLADDMVHAVERRPGALALMAFAASKLWEQRNPSTRTLDRAAYEKMGGVVGALAHHGEEVLAQMTTTQRGLVREVFRRLVTADGTSAVTREDDLVRVLGGGDAARSVIDRLVAGRLLVVRESEDGHAMVEVIHESLFSSWSLLAEWRQEDAAGGRLLDQIRAAAQAWEARGRSRSLLWRGELLEEYKRWQGLDRRGLTESEEAFARASVADGERARRLRAAVIVLLAVAALTTSYVAWQQSIARRGAQTATLDARRAEAQSNEATHEAEVSAARARDAARLAAARLHAEDPTMQLALLRDLEAPDAPRDWAPEARAALHAGVASAVYSGHVGPVWSVAYSPDGRWVVSGGVDTTVRVWKADGSGVVRVLRGHTERVVGVAVSGDGTRIASASRDGTVRLWNANGSGEPVVLHGHEGGVMAVAFSPDGLRVASGGADATVRVWNVDGSGEPVVLRGHAGAVNGVAFGPDGRRIASSSSDQTARVWNADGSGSPLVLRGHTGRLRGIAFSPDGQRIATGAWDHTIRVWDAHGRGSIVLTDHGAVGGVSFSPDGRTIAAASADQTWRIWNADGSGEPRSFRGHTEGVIDVAFSRDGTHVVSGGFEGDVRVWRVDLPEDPLVLGPQIEALEELAVSADGRLAATPATDTAVYVWKTDGSGLAARLRGHTDQVSGVAFSPDSQTLAAGSADETVRLWDLAHPEKSNVLRGHTGDVSSVAFSPDGRTLLSGSRDHTLRLWDLSGASSPLVFRGHTDLVSSVAFSPDGRRIASTSWDKTVRVWNADGSGEPLVLTGHTQAVYGVAFSPDGKQVASASADQTVRLWNADGSGEPLVFHGGSTEVDSVAFRPDGLVLAAAGVDNAIRLWNVDGTGEPVVVQGGFPALFSPDGRRLFGRSLENKLQVYQDVAPLRPDDTRLWRATSLCVSPEKLVELLGVATDVAHALHDRCGARVASAR